MRRDEIFALLRAHRNRAQPVAFFHVLRQPALEADDHAFLQQHIEELNTIDLLRWRARCDKGATSPVIQQLARIALRDQAQFRHEVLDAPHLDLEEGEWAELADLLRGKADAETWQRIEARGARAPAPEPAPFAGAGPGEAEPLGDLFSPGEGGDLFGSSSGGGELGSFLDGLDGDGFGFGDDAGAPAKGPLDAPPPEDQDWAPSVSRFQPSFRDAVLERARKTPRGDERAVLLEWLEQQDVPRRALIQVAADAIRGGGEISASVLTWLAQRLGSRSAWDREGTGVIAALIERRAFSELSELFTFSSTEASSGKAAPRADDEAEGEPEDTSRGFLGAAQAAFALALIQVTREAAAAGRPDRAMAALSALACLDPPSRVSRAIHELRQAPGIDEEVRSLVEVNERLVKHSDARGASLEGIVAAVHALADAYA